MTWASDYVNTGKRPAMPDGKQRKGKHTPQRGNGMSYNRKDMSGALFANDKKTQPNHPNAKGTALIAGVEYSVSAWTKTDKNGKKYQSMSFEPKQQQNDGFLD